MSFRFKQFFVEDAKCAMKVGTDGVLLGAWAPTAVSRQPSAIRILDVGTGSGLIALMLAQRCPNAQIDAIDIDEAAVEQARGNAEISDFKSQISNFVSRLQDWKPETKYDLIVSNPPYFQNSLKNPDKGRELARHTDSLSYRELLAHSARLLKDEGQLALILPAEAETEVRGTAADHSLYFTRVTRVFSKETKPARRVMIAFSHQPSAVSPIEDTLVLEDEKGGRSAAYSELTKDFYL
jgi:tRNA1Val (adenine37-N6)-methyltransferase